MNFAEHVDLRPITIEKYTIFYTIHNTVKHKNLGETFWFEGKNNLNNVIKVPNIYMIILTFITKLPAKSNGIGLEWYNLSKQNHNLISSSEIDYFCKFSQFFPPFSHKLSHFKQVNSFYFHTAFYSLFSKIWIAIDNFVYLMWIF